jgi:hypothetical protein
MVAMTAVKAKRSSALRIRRESTMGN